MKLRPLIIDEDARNKFRKVIEHAEANVFTMDDLLDIYNKQGTIAGDMKEFTCILPFGYRIVYSIEEQNPSKVRHLSISVNEDDKLPNELAVKEIIKEFGFTNELENCLLRLEPIGPNRQAINIIEIITP